jgi:Mg-chelatase subunit ChlD
MDQICSRCGTTSSGASRFCRACGTTLGATMTEQRTVVLAPETPVAQTRQGLGHTVLQWARNTVGAGNPVEDTSVMEPGFNAQRELTFFVLDISGSMGEEYDSLRTKLQAAQRAVTSMVINSARLDDQDEIGVIAFDHSASIALPLCKIASDKLRIIEAIQSLKIRGGTDINKGLKAAREAFDWDRRGVVRRIILVTDGHGGHPLQTAEDLKKRGVVIDIIGVGDRPANVAEKLLKRVASKIEGETRYRFIKDERTLVSCVTDLANKTAVKP